MLLKVIMGIMRTQAMENLPSYLSFATKGSSSSYGVLAVRNDKQMSGGA